MCESSDMWPSSTLSALLLLLLRLVSGSQPPQPPPYTTAYPAEMNLWDAVSHAIDATSPLCDCVCSPVGFHTGGTCHPHRT